MMHLDLAYQLRQVRNHELLMEAEEVRTTQELRRTRRLPEYGKTAPAMLKFTVRYARYILSTLTTVGFAGIN